MPPSQCEGVAPIMMQYLNFYQLRYYQTRKMIISSFLFIHQLYLNIIPLLLYNHI